MEHSKNCRWEKTTSEECEFRNTHHYCPHPEHQCDCSGVDGDIIQKMFIQLKEINEHRNMIINQIIEARKLSTTLKPLTFEESDLIEGKPKLLNKIIIC